MKARYVVGLVLVGLGVYACASSDSNPDSTSEPAPTPAPTSAPTGTTPAPTGTTPAPTGSTAIGTAGGSVTADGIALAIPAGALTSDTPIAITSDGVVPSDYSGLSPLFSFSPDGTVFNTPITVAFTLATPGIDPVVYWSNATGGYDALPTTVTTTGVTAEVAHFSHGFVAERKKAPVGDDAGTDSGTADSGTIDSGASDASTPDSGTTDSGAADAGANGITVMIDSVSTTFAANAAVTIGGVTTIKADDNASSTHWTLQLSMTAISQQACSPNGVTSMLYQHYTNGSLDSTFTSKITGGLCTLMLTHNPAAAGEHATGKILSATLGELNASTPQSHVFANGTFDLIYAP